jgi:hypothetical protein
MFSPSADMSPEKVSHVPLVATGSSWGGTAWTPMAPVAYKKCVQMSQNKVCAESPVTHLNAIQTVVLKVDRLEA